MSVWYRYYGVGCIDEGTETLKFDVLDLWILFIVNNGGNDFFLSSVWMLSTTQLEVLVTNLHHPH